MEEYAKVSTYIYDRMDELTENYEKSYRDALNDIVKEVKEKFGTQCKCVSCGEYDSTGYALKTYAIAFIALDGTLGLIDFQEEFY